MRSGVWSFDTWRRGAGTAHASLPEHLRRAGWQVAGVGKVFDERGWSPGEVQRENSRSWGGSMWAGAHLLDKKHMAAHAFAPHADHVPAPYAKLRGMPAF